MTFQRIINVLRNRKMWRIVALLCIAGSVTWTCRWYQRTHSLNFDGLRAIELRGMNEEEVRDYVHGVLRNPFSANDGAKMYLEMIGNKDSIPLLIAHAPTSESEECGNSRAALLTLSNHDFGFDRLAWKQWWETVKHKSFKEIQLDGFKVAGLPVSNPPDLKFARALLRTLRHENRYLPRNAGRIFYTLPKELQDAAIQASMESPEQEDRLGVIAWLCPIKRVGGSFEEITAPAQLKVEEDLLRSLTRDPDNTVQREALKMLNFHLRWTTPYEAGELVRYQEKFEGKVTDVFEGVDDEHLLLRHTQDRESQLVSFNLKHYEREWSRKTFFSAPFVHGGNIYYCTGGKLVCVAGENGETVWERAFDFSPAKGTSVAPNKLLFSEDMVVMLSQNGLHAFSQMDGALCWEVPPGLCEDPARRDRQVYERLRRSTALREGEGRGLRFKRQRSHSEIRRGLRTQKNENILHNDEPAPVPCSFSSVEYTQGNFFVLTHDDEILKINENGTIVKVFNPIPKEIMALAHKKSDQEVDNGCSAILADGGCLYVLVYYAIDSGGDHRSLRSAGDLRAYSTETFSELWKTEYEHISKHSELCIKGTKLILTSSGESGAIEKSTGKKIWTEYSSLSGNGFDVLDISENYILSTVRSSNPELRDINTGEIFVAYPDPSSPFQSMCVDDDFVATSDREGVLWLLRIPEERKPL
jgi:outer membrane protein assembly factor BamB